MQNQSYPNSPFQSYSIYHPYPHLQIPISQPITHQPALQSQQNSSRIIQSLEKPIPSKSYDLSTHYPQKQEGGDYAMLGRQNTGRITKRIGDDFSMEGKNISQVGTVRQTDCQLNMVNSLQRTSTQKVPVTAEKYFKSGSQRIFFHYQNVDRSFNPQEEGYEEREGSEKEIIWQNKLGQMVGKFIFLGEKMEIIFQDLYIIEEYFETVSTQEEWNELRTKYTEIIQKFNYCRQTIFYTLEQYQQPISVGVQNIWEQRYYEILQQYEIVVQQLQMKRNLDQNQHGTSIQLQSAQNNNAQLQNALSYLNVQYKELQQGYKALAEAYNQVLSQLQQRQAEDVNTPQQQMVVKMESELKDAQHRIQLLEAELGNRAENMQIESQNEIQEYEKRAIQLANQNNILITKIGGLHKQLQRCNTLLEEKDELINEYNMIKEQLEEKCNSLIINSSENGEYQVKLQETLNLLEYRDRQLENYKNFGSEQKKIYQQFEQKKALLELQKTQLQNKADHFEKEVNRKDEMLHHLQNKITLLQGQIQEKMMYDEAKQLEEYKLEINEKNKKINYLVEQIQELQSSYAKNMKEKDLIIQEMLNQKKEEDENLLKKNSQKQLSFRAFSEKIKLLEHQLANRNLEISRFRFQKPAQNADDVKELHLMIEKKNSELQQLKKEKEAKNFQIWEQEQNLNTLHLEISNKTYEINKLRRMTCEISECQSQITTLNNTIKKKNQEINQLKITVLQKQHLKREKQKQINEIKHLNQKLREKSSECEKSKTVIKGLEDKLTKLNSTYRTIELVGRQKDSEKRQQIEDKTNEAQIKKLKYELELSQTKKMTLERTIKQISLRMIEKEKKFSYDMIETDSKLGKYQKQIQSLHKEISNLRSQNEEKKNKILGLDVKISSLEKIQSDNELIFDRQVNSLKKNKFQSQKMASQIQIENQLLKEKDRRIERENDDLKRTIVKLEEKIETKNKQLEEIKYVYIEKQTNEKNNYKKVVLDLGNQLKISDFRIKNMENQIGCLQKKIKTTQEEKDKYKDRLYTQSYKQKGKEREKQAFFTEFDDLSQTKLNEISAIRMKPVGNELFEQKIIYELKKENQFLRRQMLVNYNHPTIIPEKQLKVQGFSFNEKEEISQKIVFFKQKNKKLQVRINELLKANKQLNSKLFEYKDKISSLENIKFYQNEIANTQKMKVKVQQKLQMTMNENLKLKGGIESKDRQIERTKEEMEKCEEKIVELNQQIKSQQNGILKYKSQQELMNKQIKYLKQQWIRQKKEREKLSQVVSRIEIHRKKQQNRKEQIKQESQQTEKMLVNE